ncbi:MAG: glycosyltransferase family 4 protein [Armatimonadota bacterium]|nr:glycosyltransferase family 4 protein [Armatimonadota bacterium]
MTRAKRACHLLHGPYLTDPRVRREAEALAEAGWEVDVICLHEEGKPRRDSVNNVRVLRLPLARKRGSVFRYLFEYVAFFVMTAFVLTARLGKRYRLIHVNNMPDFLVFAALLPKLLGSKVLLDVHDPMPELFQSKYGFSDSSPIIRFLRWQLKRSMHFADAVVTVSDEMRRLLSDLLPGVEISVVMNMPNASFVKLGQIAEDQRFTNRNGFRLLYTGTVAARYGVRVAVEAMPVLKKLIPGVSLCVVGSGDQLEELKQLARDLGVADCVDFRGAVPWTEIPKLIQESDLGVSVLLKDPHTDLCFTNKVVEYVTCGLPTVVSRTRTSENYYSQDTVRFVEPGSVESFVNAVVELYHNPDLRRSMSRRGMALAEKWNWDCEKIKYVELVERLTGLG